MLKLLLQPDMIRSAIRLSVPLLLASVGACYMVKVNLFNIALEGMMLVGAYIAAAVTYWTTSPVFGLFCGMLAGMAMGFLFSSLTINLNANLIIVGIALNFFAVGLTTVFLELMFGIRGILRSERIVSFSTISIPLLHRLPIVGDLISGHDPIVYLTLTIAIVATLVMYRTPLGLRVRAVGEHPEAAKTAGIDLNVYRHLSSLFCGSLCGIAGAYLPLGGLSMFTENMTAGKGFIALSAALFANGYTVMACMASLIFGYAEALAMRLQRYDISSHFVLMTPYVLTILFLFIGVFRQVKR